MSDLNSWVKEYGVDGNFEETSNQEDIVQYLIPYYKINRLLDIEAENKKLREALEFYTHEKYRAGYSVTGIMQGHRYDIACGACNEENKGRVARKTLKELYEDKR